MVKIGVIGAGYLGKFHIEKLISLKDCQLIAIADVDKKRLLAYKDMGILLTNDYKELAKVVDAVSIVTPTIYHYDMAKFFLEKNIHIFLEKPAASTVNECEDLLKMVKKDIVVQVGHIERFNPAYVTIKKNINKPKSILFKRKSPFTDRGADVDVIYDLMIHDIDLALNIIDIGKNDIQLMFIKGESIVTDKNDYILAGFILNDVLVTIECSRASNKKERSITVLCENAIWEGDFNTQEVYYNDKNGRKVFSVERVDTLKMELQAFLTAIKTKSEPPVTLKDGFEALKFAESMLSYLKR